MTAPRHYQKIVDDVQLRTGKILQPHQLEAVDDAHRQRHNGKAHVRMCLYHRTGAGKTITALTAARVMGVQEVLVMAPPVTHGQWVEQGEQIGVSVIPVSHALFRRKDYKLDRKRMVIVDEFHLLGGQTGQGWTKLDRLARGLRAPLIIMSATPNYNDAERVYCIQHVMDPISCKGGFIQFLHRHCNTTHNPFGALPLVDKEEPFIWFKDAEEYLVSLPYVHYVEDEAIKQVVLSDIHVDTELPDDFETYGLNRRSGRIMASDMERRHAEVDHRLLTADGFVRPQVWEEIAVQAGNVSTPTLVFATHATVAEALYRTAEQHEATALLVSGKMTTRAKQTVVQEFLRGEHDLLVGTASLATGTDGLDKMCDHLLIVDDTDDDALRRQLMGRILPRGLDTDISGKVFSRLVYS